MDDDDHLPVSDEDRDAAVERLREANAQGRMDLAELELRTEAIRNAATRGELARITSVFGEPSSLAPGARPARSWSVAVFGDVTRRGSWRADRSMTPISLFGDVDLDFRHAAMTGGEVGITAVTPFGDIDLIIPAKVEVDVSGFTLFGSKRVDVQPAAPGGPVATVRLRAFTLFGSIRVRSV
jgi:uncharacterized protein DUF1707/cell wall-active antibiotic response 4TMS protein YvqF